MSTSPPSALRAGSPYEDNPAVRTFTLPVSGAVRLYGPEIAIVSTAAFQRLGAIKQLGTSYLTFRGATHTRFEHSLGTLHQAETMVQAIGRNPYSPVQVDDRARRLARLGCLLHDLPHIPFGHTLEDEFHLLERHDENPSRMQALLWDGEIGAILDSSIGKEDSAELRRILEAKDESAIAKLDLPYVADIVGNTVCADLLDYVSRDLTACGMPVALGDRFLDFLTVTSDAEGAVEDRRRIALSLDKHGMPRPDVESEVLKLLAYRYELAERVYFHHAKNAASVMIGRAVQEAGLAAGSDTTGEQDRNFWQLSDDLLLQALATPAVANAIGLTRVQPGDLELASNLANGVLARKLHKIAFLAVHDDLADGVTRICQEFGRPDGRRALEDELADKAGTPHGSVLVHVPAAKMMVKAALVRVRTAHGDIITLQDWDGRHSRRVQALNDAHRSLWRVTVYLDPAYADRRDIVAAAAQDALGGANRYQPVPTGSRYLEAVFGRLAVSEQYTHDDRNALDHVAASASLATLAEAEAVVQAAVDARRAEALDGNEPSAPTTDGE